MRQGNLSEGHLQASKWLDCQFLVDDNELAHLFDILPPFFLYTCGAVCKRGEGLVSKDTFLHSYRDYINLLKQGAQPDSSLFRSRFSVAMTVDEDCLFAIPVPEGKEIIRAQRPVVQVQSHHMSYSDSDQKFHPMVYGTECISWGLQLSYPQLYRDQESHEVCEVRDTDRFPNTKLFKALQKWLREATIPTPFIIQQKQINVPMRLGKGCISWVNNHPHLLQKGITVKW